MHQTTQKISTLILWVLAWIPALAILILIGQNAVPIPYHDAWVFIEQYQAFKEGQYSWGQFFAPHNNHPSAIGKFLYFSVLEWAGGDTRWLCGMSWLFSLGISLALLRLTRPLWQGHSLRGALLCLLINLTVFSGSQAETWIWEFVFQNFIPGLCLALGIAALVTLKGPILASVMALILGTVACFSFGSGFVVGFLFLPLVWLKTENWGRAARWSTVVGWAVAMGVISYIALVWLAPTSPAGESAGGRITEVAQRVPFTLQYLLILLGFSLGQGSTVEAFTSSTATGAVLCVLFACCMVRLVMKRDLGQWRAALPWLLCCAWGALNAALICYGRMAKTLETALASRYVTFTLFFVVGVVMLVCVVCFHRSDEEKEHHGTTLPSWFRGSLLGALLMLHAFSWVWGFQSAAVYNKRMVQEKAVLSLATVVPPEDGDLWYFKDAQDTLKWAQFLRKENRLRDVNFATSAEISGFRRSSKASSRWAGWSLVHKAGDASALRASGSAALAQDLVTAADIVLLTLQTDTEAERIFAMIRPEVPDDFYERRIRRRLFREHYFGWEREIKRSELPQGKSVVVRAYAYESESRRLRQIEGEYTLP